MDSATHPALRHRGETCASSGSVQPESPDLKVETSREEGGGGEEGRGEGRGEWGGGEAAYK